MTTNEITETLTEIRDAVVVPPVDQVAFQRLVVRERRRRTTGRVLLASAAASSLAAGVGLAVQLDAPDEASPMGTPEQVTSGDRADDASRSRTCVTAPAGSATPMALSVDAGERLEEVLGLTEQGVVGSATTASWWCFRCAATADRPRPPLIDGHPSSAPGCRRTGGPSVGSTSTTWCTCASSAPTRTTGRVRLASRSSSCWPWTGTTGSRATRTCWPCATSTGLVRRGAGGRRLGRRARGSTLAVGGREGVEIFSAVDGSPSWPGGIGGSKGALSPDGSAYAAGYPQEHVDSGASQILEVIRTSDGSTETITGVDYDGVLDISWTGTNFLALITIDGKESVLECSAEALACEERILPTDDTLQLPSS